MDGDSDLRPPTPLETVRRWWGPARQYRLTRAVVLRLVGVVYLFAFLGLVHQGLPLLGERGLTPVADFLARVDQSGQAAQVPTLFWLDASDGALTAAAWLGLALSILVVAGFANLPILLGLWLLYGSFVHTGQTWFSFGWEIQLLETGVLAALLAPPLDPRPLAPRAPPRVMIALFGWLAFRIMLGAGLIKIRGDACWRELTCLDWHFETQPIPNPLSPWFHDLPHGVLATGVVVNHVCELLCPWLLLLPRPARLFGALAMIAFQLTLIASGNLSFLNWLTLVPLVALIDDDAWRRLLPGRARTWLDDHPARPPSRGHTIAAWLLAGVVAILSLAPIENLLSSDQSMNRRFDRLALVNTYGAFGSVGELRD